MTILIIGGTGQLGIALSRELRARGKTFITWGSRDLDITNKQKVQIAIFNLNPLVIVNCAAWTDVDGAENREDEAFLLNAIGAENVALAAKECGAKLVHISTDYVFSGDSSIPWKINDSRDPKTAYGRSKLAGEEKVLKVYPNHTFLLRTAWLYSPWKKNFMKTVLRLASGESIEIKMVDDQIGQPTSAIDVAIRIIELIESSIENGIFHATNSGEASWFDFAKEILEIHDGDTSRLMPVASSEFKQQALRPRFSVLDHENWSEHSFIPMQEWKFALRNTIKIIKSDEVRGSGNA